MKKLPGKKVLTACVVAGLSWANAADAVVVPVIDAANLISNVVQNYQLAAIKRSLAAPAGGNTINHYTNSIDISNTSIEKSTTINTEINADFTWINNEGDEEVPIPGPENAVLKAVIGSEGSAAYVDKFQSAEFYMSLDQGAASEHIRENAGIDGSRARKSANDALIKSIEAEQVGIATEVQALDVWSRENIKTQGHGHQLQMANALATTQANQLMKLRSMMLVSDAVRAAEAQSAADKEARAMATSKAMRKDVGKYTLAAPPPVPVF